MNTNFNRPHYSVGVEIIGQYSMLATVHSCHLLGWKMSYSIKHIKSFELKCHWAPYQTMLCWLGIWKHYNSLCQLLIQFQAMGHLPKMMGNKNLWLPGRELLCAKSCIPGKNSPDALWTKGLSSSSLGTWADGTPWVQSQRGGSMAICLVSAPIVFPPSPKAIMHRS